MTQKQLSHVQSSWKAQHNKNQPLFWKRVAMADGIDESKEVVFIGFDLDTSSIIDGIVISDDLGAEHEEKSVISRGPMEMSYSKVDA